MSPGIFTSVFAVFTAMALIAGIWLMLHLTALAALFNGKADIVAAPTPPRATRGTVIAVIIAFCVGVVGVLSSQVIAIIA